MLHELALGRVMISRWERWAFNIDCFHLEDIQMIHINLHCRSVPVSYFLSSGLNLHSPFWVRVVVVRREDQSAEVLSWC